MVVLVAARQRGLADEAGSRLQSSLFSQLKRASVSPFSCLYLHHYRKSHRHHRRHRPLKLLDQPPLAAPSTLFPLSDRTHRLTSRYYAVG